MLPARYVRGTTHHIPGTTYMPCTCHTEKPPSRTRSSRFCGLCKEHHRASCIHRGDGVDHAKGHMGQRISWDPLYGARCIKVQPSISSMADRFFLSCFYCGVLLAVRCMHRHTSITERTIAEYDMEISHATQGSPQENEVQRKQELRCQQQYQQQQQQLLAAEHEVYAQAGLW